MTLSILDKLELLGKFHRGGEFSQRDKLNCLMAYYDILEDFGDTGAPEHWRLINEGNLDNDYCRIFDKIKTTVMMTIERGVPYREPKHFFDDWTEL